MPHNSDQSDNSDDLIAELARLMAEDAKVDTADSSPAPGPVAPEASSKPAAHETAHKTADVPAFHRHDETSAEQPLENDRFGTQPDTGEELAPEQDLMREIERSLRAEDMSEADSGADVSGEPQQSFYAAEPKVASSQPEAAASNGPVFEAPAEPETGGASDELLNLFGRTTPDRDNEAPAATSGNAGANHDPIADLIREREREPDSQASQAEKTEGPPSVERQPVRAAQTERRPDDNFDVNPVFGLGGATAGSSHQADPLDEIENLIGNAVRDTGADRSSVSSPKPAPAPTAEPRFDDAATAAEAAILAATQASGKREALAPATGTPHASGNVEPEFTHFGASGAASTPGPEASERIEDKRGGTLTRWATPAAALVVFALLGGGAYWYFGMNGESATGAAPVLASNTTGAKQDVEPADISAAAGTDSVVMNELSGNNGVSASETLVSRDQSGSVASTSDAGGDSGNVSRVIEPEDGETGLANRKVRTVTVRPDGTIISGEDVLAGSEVLPVDRPDVPALPEGTAGTGENVQISEGFADEPGTVDTAAISPAGTPDGTVAVSATTGGGEIIIPEGAPAPAPRLENRTVAAAVAQQLLTAPAITPGAQTGGGNTNGAIDLLGNPVTSPVTTQTNTPTQTNTQETASTAAATTQASANTSGPSAPAYVQLSSQRTPEAAQQTIASLNSRFGTQLGGGNLEVQQVDLQDRGIFYRVRLPANSIESANNICASIKNAGGDCFVRTE